MVQKIIQFFSLGLITLLLQACTMEPASQPVQSPAKKIKPQSSPSSLAHNGLVFASISQWSLVDSPKYTAVLGAQGSRGRLNIMRLESKGPFADAKTLQRTVDRMCKETTQEDTQWGAPQPAVMKKCGLGTCAWCKYVGGSRAVVQAVGLSEKSAYIMTWFSLPSDTERMSEAVQHMLTVREKE